MNSKKSFHALVKQMESLKEEENGKLRGGFSSYVGSSVSVAEGTNNCRCKNKNRGKACSGCGSTNNCSVVISSSR